MSLARSVLIVLPLCLLTAAVTALAPIDRVHAEDDERYAKLAPFTATRFEGDAVHVQVRGAWYRLVALDGTPAADIVAWCRTTYGRRWQKRFTEDLVEVLSRMGQPPGATVSLDLVDERGTAVREDAVAMTARNRRAAWEARNARGGGAQKVRRIEREHARTAGPEYADLVRVVEGADDGAGPRLSAEQVGADLDQLEWSVVNTYSYRDLTGVDVPAAFDAVRLSGRGGLSRDAFAIQLMKLLGRFGDGHTRVETGKRRLLARGYAPFLLGDAAGGVAVFTPTRSGFVDEQHPFLHTIDGRPIALWIEAAGRIEAQGSPQFLRANALRNLRYLAHVRRELGLAESDTVVLGLADRSGKQTKDVELPLVREIPVYGPWPRAEPRGIPDEIGYLRIASMSSDAQDLARIDAALARHAKSRGLLVDVRGNGGGSRHALRHLLPYLLTRDSAPVVTNVARYRMQPGDTPDLPQGYLGNRFLYPRWHRGWSEAEREVIDGFGAAFRPEWEPAPPQFSDWHYMLVGPDTNPAAFAYPGKVVVLTDARCFSATDVFVGALATLPNVELVGTATGGGSGRSQGLRLVHSGLRVRLSTMASFTPGGQRYDGRGIAVDVEVLPAATDFLGTTDAVLDAALGRIR